MESPTTTRTKYFAFAAAPNSIVVRDFSNLLFLKRSAGEPFTYEFSSNVLFPTYEGASPDLPAVRENPWTLGRIKQMQPSLEKTCGCNLVLIGVIEEKRRESGTETQHRFPGIIEVTNFSSVFARFALEILDTEKKQNEFAARVV